MIELRYVMRYVPVAHTTTTGENHVFISERKPVLQYRKFALGIDASGALTPAGSPGWSDWQDVPTVEE